LIEAARNAGIAAAAIVTAVNDSTKTTLQAKTNAAIAVASLVALAASVGLSESTVSRAVKGKRLRLPHQSFQVLALLLDGLQLSEIAERLHITSSTVQDHIRRLLEKTNTHNRSEMAARILGWAKASGDTRP